MAVMKFLVYVTCFCLSQDALPEPQVTCELDETSNMKKLSCSVVSQTQPSYEWSGPDMKQPGPTLLVNEQEENHNSVYTCTVKKKAGSRTTDFTLQDCHTDSPSNLDISVPSSNLNMELENKQTAFFPQEEDDDGEQTDKSSESEQGMKKKNYVPEIKETKN